MFYINEHFTDLPGAYLFAEVARRVQTWRNAHPGAEIVSLGIGDVTRPLTPAVISALHEAATDMGQADTFHGYGPEQGYAFLREAIAAHDYAPRGVRIAADEIFISDGAKCDIGNFQELFAQGSVIAVTDPVYPVYVDANAMAGNAGTWNGTQWSDIVYLPCTAENHFVPDFPSRAPDVIYLCYPNNPTGTVLDKAALRAWVEYARRHGSLILYDGAYEAYISDDAIPHSIYEVDGAREVAVEFRSFSKTAGFTGLRCAYAVVPKELCGNTAQGGRVPLNPLWARRQTTKYNGCPYLVQKAAAAIYTPQGQSETRALVREYMDNARAMRESLASMGLAVTGGIHAPYLWVRAPGGMTSWEFFQVLLEKAQVVCTPGVGFGPNGEGYVRFTAFGAAEKTTHALKRIALVL